MSEKCPLCGYSLDVHSPITEKQPVKPSENDITVCLNCHSLLIFNRDLKLRNLTKEELFELESDAEFWSDLVSLIHTMRTLPSIN